MVAYDELTPYEIFRELTDEELREIAPYCEMRQYEAGETMFNEGEPTRYLFLVKQGRVAVQINVAPDRRTNVFIATRGAAVGWSAVVPPHRTTASAHVVEPSTVIAIDGQGLRKACDAYPRIGYKVMSAMAHIMRERMHDTRLQLINLIYAPHATGERTAH